MLATMFCRIYGRLDVESLQESWVSLINSCAIEGTIFNQENILTSSMLINFQREKNPSKREHSDFYMASYLLDALCVKCEFDRLGWKWNTDHIMAIHIYYKILWKRGYWGMYENIVWYFISPIYHIIFATDPLSMSNRSRSSLHEISYWFT